VSLVDFGVWCQTALINEAVVKIMIRQELLQMHVNSSIKLRTAFFLLIIKINE